MERNRFDNRDSLERGKTAQEKFKVLAENRGWEVFKSSGEQDIDEHWDYIIKNKSSREEFKVDVKARKRLRRWDKNLQDDWVWIELHSVRNNDEGWLFGGKADLFAFETQDKFIIIKKRHLIELVENHVVKNEKVIVPDAAKYKIYSRSGRPDKITLIEMKLIEANKWDIWTKL